jgi:two-component system phosphate regulon response regulator PhoB
MAEGVRALVIGESAEWRARIAAALAPASLACEGLESGLEALSRLEPAVKLLVIGAHTSDVSGLALCRRVRELPGGEALTLVLVSAHADEMDRILAFENGADDFVAEPFSARELAARVRAILRRRSQRSAPREAGEVELGMLKLDLLAGVAELDGRRVRLTLREFEVLKHLALSGGRVVRRAELLQALDGEPHVSERLVDTHVKSIRSKLGGARDLIETVRGVGYRFDPKTRAAG